MSHRRHAGKRSRQAQRRVLKRISLLFLVLGLLLLLFAGSWALIALFKTEETQRKFFKLSLYYLGGGMSLLLIRGLLEGLRFRLKKQMRRAQRGELDDEPKEIHTPYSHPPPQTSHRRPERERIRRASSRRRSSRRDGAVLPLVLLLLALISTLLIRAQLQTRAELRYKENLVKQAQIQHALVETLLHRLQAIADDPILQVDPLDEPWLLPVETNRADGVVTMTRVEDLSSRFDWNNLVLTDKPHDQHRGEQIIMDILTLCGDFGPVPKIDALKDWIDADDEGYRESRHYQELDKGYPVANGPLATWGELLHVEGFTPDYFNPHERHTANESFKGNVLDTLAIIPGPRHQPMPVNLNTAPREVLLGVLGLAEENVIDFLISQRGEKPITSLAALQAAVDPTIAERASEYVDVRSHFFMLTVRGYRDGAALELSALVQRDERGDIQILQTIL